MGVGIGSSDQVVDTFGATTATTPGVATTASGSSFLIGILTSASQTITTVSDNKSNTYSLVGSALTYFSAALKVAVYKCENGTGGTGHTVSVTIGGSDFLTVFFQEVTGGTPEDTAVRASLEDTASTFDITGGTPAQAAECVVVFAGCNTSAISGLSEANGFTITQSVLTGASDAPGWSAAKVIASTSQPVASFTGTGLTTVGMFMVSIKETSTALNVNDDYSLPFVTNLPVPVVSLWG